METKMLREVVDSGHGAIKCGLCLGATQYKATFRIQTNENDQCEERLMRLYRCNKCKKDLHYLLPHYYVAWVKQGRQEGATNELG